MNKRQFVFSSSFSVPTSSFLLGRVAQPGESVCLTNRRAKVRFLPRPLRSGVAKLVRRRIVNAHIGGSNPPVRANLRGGGLLTAEEHARPVSERCGFDSRRHLRKRSAFLSGR